MKIFQLRKKLSSLAPWEADCLLQLGCNNDKAFILAHPEYRLGFFELMKFYFALWKFKRGVPLAYISHHKEFYGLDFYVDKRVLTPRPETELMVEETLKKIQETRHKKQGVLLIDVGTGSGCVPIAVLSAMKQWNNETMQVIATDISRRALQVAKLNAKNHGVSINFLQGNLLEPVIDEIASSSAKTPRNDRRIVVTANLPYGWKAWKNNGSIETKRLNFEPQVALFTGENGLELYRKLLEQIREIRNLKLEIIPSEFPISNFQFPVSDFQFHIFLEFDPRQTESLSNLIKTEVKS